jgi:two-component system, cell cycle sensor histidine kinase PleC
VNITTPIDSDKARATAPDEDARLVAGGAATFLVDSTTGAIVAANAAASDELGVGATHAAMLDPAMPAWTVIRAFADEQAGPSNARRPLLFWTAAGPRAIDCRMDLVSRGPRTLVRVSTAVTFAAPVADEAAQVRQRDMATLREIARRIKAGSGPAAVPETAASIAGPDAAAPIPAEGPAPPPALDFRPLPAAARDAKLADRDPATGAGEIPPDLLAKLAHELRTPLSAIVSLAEIMRDEQLGAIGNARYKVYAADIHETARHTLDLVAAMLDARRSSLRETALETLDLSHVSLNDIVHSSTSAMRPIADRSGVELIIHAAPGLPNMHADRRAVRQMILNLLSNALRHTAKGGCITLTTALDRDGSILLAIVDTGSGMRPEEIARAVSNDPGIPRPKRIQVAGGHPGSGIGLPLVRALAEAHGGRLAIESSPSNGTAIRISFPADRVVVS